MIRALPAVLLLLSLGADLSDRHALAFVVLLAAIPSSGAAALEAYGDSIAGRCGGSRPLVAGLATALVVIATTLRSPAVVGGVPHLAITLCGLALLLYVAIGVGALRPVIGAAPVRG